MRAALGRFLREAARQPWFDDTLFVVVADHGARVYGKAEIPLRTYEIPLLVYAPKHLAPRRIDTLMTQIDIAPTVLDLAGIARPREFVGRSLLSDGAAPVFAEMIGDAHLQAAIAAHDGRLHKLVRWVDDDVRLLFDLDRDPGETEDRLGDPEAPRDAAEALLDVFSALTGRAAARAP